MEQTKPTYDEIWRWPDEQRNQYWCNLAKINEPEGATCGWCGKPNDLADDCGWYYITPTGNDSRPTCNACYDGPLGQAHTKRFGVGER